MTGIRYDLSDTIVPVGAVVGTTDTQNLTNKTLGSPIISAGLTTDTLTATSSGSFGGTIIANPPSNPAEGQIKVTVNDTGGHMGMLVYGADNLALTFDAEWTGTNWTARDTHVACFRKVSDSFTFQTKTGATPGNTVAFTDRVQFGMEFPTIFINEDTNTDMTIGLTINQGDYTDEILTFKSTDVAHGLTNRTETDTYFYIKKFDSVTGGAMLESVAMSAGQSQVLGLRARGGQAQTTKEASTSGMVHILCSQHDGLGNNQDVNANGALFTIAGRNSAANQTKWVLDIEGDTYQAGNIMPFDYSTQDIGSPTATWNDIYCETLYTSAGSIVLGSVTLTDDGTNFLSDTEFKAPSGADDDSFATVKYVDDEAGISSHTQGTDTTLGTMTADIDMDSSYQIVNLQAPDTAGDALRQTVNITEADLEQLTDGSDTTLHDHDGISENTSDRHTQGTDTTLGTVTADIDMDGSYQVVGLQAPANAGEALRQTVNITEADLEQLTDGSDTTLHDHDGISENTSDRHTQGTDTTMGTMTADIDMDGSYQIVGLQAPANAGEALRQTVNITEADLEQLTDGSDTTLHDHDGISENTSDRHAQSHDNDDHTTNYLAEIVTDTTPQLGGDLDLNVKCIDYGAILTVNGQYEGLKMTVDVDDASAAYGLVLAQAADFSYDRADADTAAQSVGLVIALESGTGLKEVLIEGQICATAWDWDAGLLYLSAAVGTMTQTQPAGAGDQVVAVGWALSADTIYFKPSMVLVEIAA